MTKKKLISWLEDIPDDAEVYVPSGEKPGYISPCFGIVYEDETNTLIVFGEDFESSTEASDDQS